MNFWCNVLGHKYRTQDEDTGVMIGTLKVINVVAVCKRCGRRVACGVIGINPDGRRSEIRVKPMPSSVDEYRKTE